MTAIPSAVDPPFGERAAAGAATFNARGTWARDAGGSGGGLLGSPGSSADGMVPHPGAGALPPEAQ